MSLISGNGGSLVSSVYQLPAELGMAEAGAHGVGEVDGLSCRDTAGTRQAWIAQVWGFGGR